MKKSELRKLLEDLISDTVLHNFKGEKVEEFLQETENKIRDLMKKESNK